MNTFHHKQSQVFRWILKQRVGFYNSKSPFSHFVSRQIPICILRVLHCRGSSYRPKHISFGEWRQVCLDCFLPFRPILPLTTFDYRSMFIIMYNLMSHWEYKQIIDNYLIPIPKIITTDYGNFSILGIVDLFMSFNLYWVVSFLVCFEFKRINSLFLPLFLRGTASFVPINLSRFKNGTLLSISLCSQEHESKPECLQLR